MTIQLDDALHGLAESSASVDRTAASYELVASFR
jgi:hypothetical protein